MPIVSTAQFNVNTSTAGDQTAPVSLMLANGSMVLAWHDVTNGGRIAYRMMAADGTWGSEQVTAASTAVGTGEVDIVATAAGGFAIVYKTDATGGGDLISRTFDGAGGQLFGPTQLTSTVADSERSGNVHQLNNGNMVVISGDATDGDQLTMRFLNASGTGPGAEIVIDTGVNVDQPQTAVANLTNGNFVVFWQRSVAGTTDIVGQQYDAAGAVVGSMFAVNATIAANQANPNAIQLANGNILVSWHTDGSNAIVSRVFTADLALVGSEVTVNQVGETLSSNASATQLADGRIVFVWEADGDIKARLFNSTATTALGNAFTVGTDNLNTQSKPSVVAHADGRFTVVWQSGDTGGGEAGQGIRSQTFDPSKFNGTGGDDIHAGGDWTDTMFGNAGADLLNGNGGNDTINGGDGNDSDGLGNTLSVDGLKGGAGNDIINGEAGNDTLLGEGDNDVLNGGAGADKLKGGDGNDTLIGGADADYFDGGAGDDTVSYFNGTAATVNLANAALNAFAALGDTWNTASIVENVIGSSTGNDTITGSSVANKLYGMGGIDILNGGGNNDTLFGGNGNDTLNGEAGNDFLYGGDGNDTMRGGSSTLTTTTGNDTFYWSNGNDSHDGQDGIDTMDFAAASVGATASLDNTVVAAGAAAGDSFTAIENLNGSNNALVSDSLTGSSVVNILRGNAGNDTLIGKDGDDTLEGGSENDIMAGGTSLTADTSTVGNQEDSLAGGAGNDIYIGGAGMDTFKTDATGNEIYRYVQLTDGGSAVGVLGGDKIASFNAGDGFEFKGTAFGSLAVQADLGLTLFESLTNTNVATQTTTRFVYNQLNDTLWYDPTGSTNGAADAYCIADFGPSNINLLRTDIAII